MIESDALSVNAIIAPEAAGSGVAVGPCVIVISSGIEFTCWVTVAEAVCP